MAYRSLVALLLMLLPGPVAAQVAGSTSAPPVYEQADLDQAPLIRNPNGCIAALNDQSPYAGSVGEAVFSFIVTADGTVDSTSIAVVTATEQRFVAAGRRTLLDARCRFTPGKKNGQPVRARIKQKLSWKVEVRG